MKKETKNVNLDDNSIDFKERLKRTKKANKLISFKRKKKAEPIFSSNQEEIKFTDQGELNLKLIKESVVVDFSKQLITTAKKIKVVTPRSLKKAKKKLDDEEFILTVATDIESKLGKFVSKNKEKLNTLSEELDKINKGIPYIYKQEEIDKKENQMIGIKKQASILKLECLLISNNSDFENFDLLKDEALLENIDTFTNKAKGEDISSLARSCKKDLDYVDNLLDVIDKTDKIDYEINSKSSEIKTRDSYFGDYKKEVLELNSVQDKINSEIKDNVLKSNELVDKIKNFTDSSDSLSTDQLRCIADDYIDYFINSDYLLKIFHFLTLNVFKDKKHEALKKLKDRQTLIKTIYSDYERELGKEISNLKQLSNNIKTSIANLSWLKTVFHDKFYQYKHLIPEYEEIYEKLDKLEKKLHHDHEVVNETKNKLRVKKMKVEKAS